MSNNKQKLYEMFRPEVAANINRIRRHNLFHTAADRGDGDKEGYHERMKTMMHDYDKTTAEFVYNEHKRLKGK